MNTVYVSSTYIDLAEHSQALKLALERAGFDVGCMEKYPAFDERPADKCLRDVAECDYYVLILAWRYGFQPTQDNPGNLSITRLEYDQAVRLGKRPLVFLLDEDHPWTKKYIDKDDANIQGFRDHVGNEHGRALFTTPDNLASQVQASLLARRKETAPPGETDQVHARAEYLDWLQRHCETMELLGLAQDDTLNVRLGRVYVPAIVHTRLRQSEIAAGELPDALLLHRLADGSLYLPGAPGAGKSTFCRWLTLVVASGYVPTHPISTPPGYQEEQPYALWGRFPLLCSLRELAGHPECLRGNGHWHRKELEDALAC